MEENCTNDHTYKRHSPWWWCCAPHYRPAPNNNIWHLFGTTKCNGQPITSSFGMVMIIIANKQYDDCLPVSLLWPFNLAIVAVRRKAVKPEVSINHFKPQNSATTKWLTTTTTTTKTMTTTMISKLKSNN